jgi:hypothetical protein
VQEATLMQFFNDALQNGSLTNVTSRDIVATLDDLFAANLNKRDGLGVAGLETDGCSCRNVETVTVGLNTIEFKLRVGFNEMIMRANLDSG